MVRVPCGLVFVGNTHHVSFAALLRAKEARRVPQDPETVVLDGVLIEVEMTTAETISAPSARGLDLLTAHQKAMSAVLSKKMRWPPLHIEGAPDRLDERPDLEVLSWHFDPPGPLEILGQQIVHVGYVTVAIDDAVFGFSVPFRKQESPEFALEKIRSIIRSIRRLDRPIDPVAFAEGLQNDPKAWPGCRDPK